MDTYGEKGCGDTAPLRLSYGQRPAPCREGGRLRAGRVWPHPGPWQLCVLRARGERRCGWKERVSHSERDMFGDTERLVHPACLGLLDCGQL